MSERFAALVCATLLFSASACTRNDNLPEDPKRRLTEYISHSFAVKDAGDRARLVEYLAGDARARLTSWSDEQFRVAFVDSKRQFIKLAFRELKTLSPTQMNVTYELTYLDQTRGRDAKVTNKKLCEMTFEQGKWLISEVRNIKELVEYRNEMSLP